jgi:Orn/Lys/Arg decarboxylase, major domain
MDKAAVTWNSHATYFVTNGTSTGNEIVVQSLTWPGDIVLIDRSCHKSHHYGLVLAGAHPVYLDAYPLPDYAIYGAVPMPAIERPCSTSRPTAGSTRYAWFSSPTAPSAASSTTRSASWKSSWQSSPTSVVHQTRVYPEMPSSARHEHGT